MNNLLKLIYTLGKNLKEEITLRELSVQAKVAYTTAYREVMFNKDIFIINKKANINLCSLNLKDSITKNYLIIAEREIAKEFLKNNKIFSLIKKELVEGDYSLVLFGSRAEGKEREKSDIDLCIINKEGKKVIKLDKFESLFDLEINPIYLSRQEFQAMIKESEENLAKQIIKKHIVLYGEEYFWRLILNDI
ncbi:MAG: nucleotidyltransferase domain-containing protein [Candidatus Nanoarchaeia archaeon]|nr:nucleotidyltransferase domain-containing protein [Candidatus Nanoarchaeia archaeon]MDD5740390.1 nucleotidyltransferase domain-containing protein [Candidatus Nanoarchaeia archaeon]